MAIHNIGVIGAGQMGTGIAHVCALAGYDVQLVDLDQDRVKKGLDLIDGNMDRARQTIHEIERLGISMEQVTAELLAEGIASFSKSFDDLLSTIESKRQELAPA